MKSNSNTILKLSYAIIFLTLIISCAGLFYSNGGEPFFVNTIFGDSIKLYGDGIYAYNTMLKAGSNKGTDMVMLLVILLFTLATLFYRRNSKAKLLHIGFLSGLLYYSTSLSFGTTYNRLFPLYLMLFSCTLFLFIIEFNYLRSNIILPEQLLHKNLKSTKTFMILAGCSVFVWLTFIIPSTLFGEMSFLEIYTTEPTFIIDLGIILPTCLTCAYKLHRKEPLGYYIVPIILTLITIVGICVIGQTIFQTSLGIVLSTGQLFGLVISFIILGTIAIKLNVSFIKHFHK